MHHFLKMNNFPQSEFRSFPPHPPNTNYLKKWNTKFIRKTMMVLLDNTTIDGAKISRRNHYILFNPTLLTKVYKLLSLSHSCRTQYDNWFRRGKLSTKHPEQVIGNIHIILSMIVHLNYTFSLIVFKSQLFILCIYFIPFNLLICYRLSVLFLSPFHSQRESHGHMEISSQPENHLLSEIYTITYIIRSRNDIYKV